MPQRRRNNYCMLRIFFYFKINYYFIDLFHHYPLINYR